MDPFLINPLLLMIGAPHRARKHNGFISDGSVRVPTKDTGCTRFFGRMDPPGFGFSTGCDPVHSSSMSA